MVPVVAWIVWDLYETRALARAIAALAARGEPTSVASIPRGGETRERYHAARVYAAAAEHVGAMTPAVTFRLPRLDVDSVAVTANLDELERTYPHDAAAIQLLEQAAPLDFTGFGDLTPDVDRSALLTLGYLGLVHADVLSARGRPDAAAAAIGACARLSRALEPFPRGQLATRMLGSIRILLRHGAPSREALAALQQAFASLPDADDLADDLRVRRARFLEEIAAPRRTLADAVVRRAMRPWVARSNRQQLATFDEAQALAAAPWPEKFVTGIRTERSYADGFRAPRRGLIGRQTSPPGLAYAGFGVRLAALELAARRIAITAAAIERHRADTGRPPASLAALVPAYLPAVPLDPFTGTPLVYAVSGTSYRLYSVDQDLKDDGGAIYGVGSRSARQTQPGQPRDLGLRIP